MWTVIILAILSTFLFVILYVLRQTKTVIVMSVCGHTDDVSNVKELCDKNGFELIVYDKCNDCNNMDNCTILPNVGREQETWLRYVIDNYPNFPDKILFLPAPINKYVRLVRGLYMLDNDHMGDIIGPHENFTIDSWNGTPLVPSETRPFKSWYEKHIGTWDPTTPAVYYNGVMATTRDRILSKSKEFYENLHRQVSISANTEVGHYLERSMGSVF